MIFPPKSIVLVANVESTLVWSGADFQQSLGYAQPEQPISMTFAVRNGTTQVCYIAISYEVRNTVYSINDRRSIAGIPAGGTLRISSNVAAELASLGPDLKNVTLYLISAGAGLITVTAEGFDKTTSPGSVGGNGQSIGLDQRSVLDYTVIVIAISQLIPPLGNLTVSYTVPALKRAAVMSYYGSCQPTPAGYGDSTVSLFNGLFEVQLHSEQFSSSQIFMSGDLGNADAGAIIKVNAHNFNIGAGNDRFLQATAIIHEFFS